MLPLGEAQDGEDSLPHLSLFFWLQEAGGGEFRTKETLLLSHLYCL